MINDNSIWPNGMQTDEEGYAVFYPMGTNKVDIPKNSPHWPKGSKLMGSFVYDKNNKLVGFCDTKAMTSNNNGEIIVMPYEEIDAEFDSIENGTIQIHAPKATLKKASWNGSDGKIDIPDVQYKYKGCKDINAMRKIDENFLENDIKDGKWTELLSDLTNGSYIFSNNVELTTFTSDLSSLTDGKWMFMSCSNLTSFESDTSSIINGEGMFYYCSNLVSFKSDTTTIDRGLMMFSNCSKLKSFVCDLKNLTNGMSMFVGCTELTHFCNDDYGSSVNLSSLTTGDEMFGRCSKIISFTSKLSSLTSGNYMFVNCSSLTSFVSDLKSLTSATYMFGNCKLDATSIKNIIDTINTVETGGITFGVGCNNNTSDANLFAQEVGYTDMTSLLAVLQNKGWTVSAQFNGRPSSNYSLRQPESLPVYVKLVEVILTEENSFYEYTSQDGYKFYNLDWFHETTGSTDGYTQFNSLEEAITHYNIKPIEK